MIKEPVDDELIQSMFHKTFLYYSQNPEDDSLDKWVSDVIYELMENPTSLNWRLILDDLIKLSETSNSWARLHDYIWKIHWKCGYFERLKHYENKNSLVDVIKDFNHSIEYGSITYSPESGLFKLYYVDSFDPFYTEQKFNRLIGILSPIDFDNLLRNFNSLPTIISICEYSCKEILGKELFVDDRVENKKTINRMMEDFYNFYHKS